ncbi:helix-turn-helix domain-containing protein [Nesterenkonia flava]|uniref:helix-turn-helix domain-containing protein n=1 Tax=Nesterenkonia flava TaxID=469799 RepID=UPI0035B61F2C
MRNTSTQEWPYTITSVSHALDVLDILVEQQTIRVRDIAQRLNVAPSSVARQT